MKLLLILSLAFLCLAQLTFAAPKAEADPFFLGIGFGGREGGFGGGYGGYGGGWGGYGGGFGGYGGGWGREGGWYGRR